MEEADVLCTRIGIVVNGKLKCLGTSAFSAYRSFFSCLGSQTHLKKKFGSGFKIDVVCSSLKSDQDEADKFITSVVKGARLVVANDGFLSYQALPLPPLIILTCIN